MDIIKTMLIVVTLAAATIANIELNGELMKSDRNDDIMTKRTMEKAMRILPEK